jgi:hypothetical protein
VSEVEPTTDESPSPELTAARNTPAKSDALREHLDMVERPAPTREGLPPSYQMRAERHYVDFLADRSTTASREHVLEASAIDSPGGLPDPATLGPLTESIKIHGLLQPLLVQSRRGSYRLIAGHKRLSAAIAAGLRKVPCTVLDVDDKSATALAEASHIALPPPPAAAEQRQLAAPADANADIAVSLATLSSCTSLLAGPGSELSRTVATGLISAELWRATCLLQASRIVRRELTLARTPVSVATLLDKTSAAFSHERKLRGFALVTNHDASDALTVVGDEPTLLVAISNAVLALLATLEGVPDARIVISASSGQTDRLTIAISQNAVAVSDMWIARAFDATWTTRPGGHPAVLALLSIQAVAEAHGGHAAVDSAGRGGRIVLSLPQLSTRR